MAKSKLSEDKKLLLRLPRKTYDQVKKSAVINKRSVNSEIELVLEEKFL